MKLIKKYYKVIMGVGIFVLLAIGIGIAQILISSKQTQTRNDQNEFKEESETIEEPLEEEEQKDNNTITDTSSDNTVKPNINNNVQNNNENTNDNTTKPNMSNDTQNDNQTDNNGSNIPNDEVNNNIQDKTIKEKLLGTWTDKDNRIVYIFEDDKFTIINVSYNNISNYEYEIKENSVIYSEKLVEIKFIDNVLYLGSMAYFKQNDDFQLPFIYYNIDKVLGTTWKMTKGNNVIYRYEDEPPIILEKEIAFTKNNIFGVGMCVGVCDNLYNFKNNKIEIYMNNIHFEMIDNDTLIQVPYGAYPDYGIEYTRIK